MKNIALMVLGGFVVFAAAALFESGRYSERAITSHQCDQLGGFTANGERYLCRNIKTLSKGTQL